MICIPDDYVAVLADGKTIYVPPEMVAEANRRERGLVVLIKPKHPQRKCTCGALFSSIDADWRFNGRRWEHHHGYPIGHVEVAGSEDWLEPVTPVAELRR